MKTVFWRHAILSFFLFLVAIIGAGCVSKTEERCPIGYVCLGAGGTFNIGSGGSASGGGSSSAGGGNACPGGCPSPMVCDGAAQKCVSPAQAVELCDGLDNNGNGSIDEGWGITILCTLGLGSCKAIGTVICDGPQATRCNAVVGKPSAEVCNGVDDNCNGYPDDGLANCKCIPATEMCDGSDNDCDGLIDEEFKSGPNKLGNVCSDGLGVCKNSGVQICSADGMSTTCSAKAGQQGVEICNNLDDDCDGVVDNGNPGGGGNCLTGKKGVCSVGTKVCQNGAPACVQNLMASQELCDGMDNNCNGSIDEGDPQGGGNCNTGFSGVCSQGVMACQQGVLSCSQVVFAINSEPCNSIDDNCNGVIDEGCSCVNGKTQNCYDGPANTGGVGLCKLGTQTCANGKWGICVGEVLPSQEICDGFDNDCNNVVDDKTIEANKACGTGLPGICGPGTTACTNGALLCNQNKMAAMGESCNTIDDNCNGQVDEGCGCTDGAQQGCYSGPMGTAGVGLCKAGSQTCVNGKWGVCVGEVQPSGEICNGKDDNCNNQTDEGNPGGNFTCVTGKTGVCGPATTACTNGVLLCNQNTPSSVETCDGKDNDCNSQTDEGCACISGAQQVCYSGPNGTAGVGKCKSGTQTCGVNGQWGACAGDVLPAAEVCDGFDNNCNGQSDEGNPGGGGGCNTGFLGVCKAGVTACQAGILVCNQFVMASGEICDGKDNDCNGQIDNGIVCP